MAQRVDLPRIQVVRDLPQLVPRLLTWASSLVLFFKGIRRDGGEYTFEYPATLGGAKIKDSGTTGGSTAGWVEVEIEGTTLYLRAEPTK